MLFAWIWAVLWSTRSKNFTRQNHEMIERDLTYLIDSFSSDIKEKDIKRMSARARAICKHMKSSTLHLTEHMFETLSEIVEFV